MADGGGQMIWGGATADQEPKRIAGSFKMADGGVVIFVGKPLTLVGEKRIAGAAGRKKKRETLWFLFFGF